MVGTKYRLEEVLMEKQIHHVVKKYVADEQWELVDADVRPASEGLSGFVGEHLKATLHVKSGGWVKNINLFIKRVPLTNQPKADFINEQNFFRREMIMFQLIDEMSPEDDPNPYSTKALICNESILVLPDLNVEGYSPRHHQEYFDLAHVFVTLGSVARLHAAFANHHTRKSQPGCPYNIMEMHGHIIAETIFQPNSSWLRAAAKLTANFLDTFSSKYTHKIPEFESKIFGKFVEACGTLKEHEDSLNVVLHKDLWANNIMFRYEKGLPVNAVLIDYQCIRYGPPSFDVMGLLYLTTSREFRKQHERKVLHYYFCIFWDSLDDATQQRMRELGYDREEFLRWCERSRMLCLCIAIGIFPFILMDPVIAQKTFDNPDTYETLIEGDRTEPVVAHARQSPVYKARQMEVAEEFAERFIVNES